MKKIVSPLILGLFLLPEISHAQSDKEFHLDEVYSIDKDGTINLSSDDADVFIIGTDRSDVHVKIDRVVDARGVGWDSRKFDVIIEEVNGNLEIRDKEWGNSSITMGYYKEEYVIRIEAPRSVSLKINGDDDDYEISNIMGNIKMTVDDGDINLENCLGKSLEFDSDDGDIIIKGANGRLYVNMDDGNLSVYNGNLTGIDIRADDSDIDIATTISDEGNYRFRIEDSSLDFQVIKGGGRFDIRHDDGRIIYDNAFIIKEEDEDYTILSLPGGNSDIRISGDDISVRLKTGKSD